MGCIFSHFSFWCRRVYLQDFLFFRCEVGAAVLVQRVVVFPVGSGSFLCPVLCVLGLFVAVF